MILFWFHESMCKIKETSPPLTRHTAIYFCPQPMNLTQQQSLLSHYRPQPKQYPSISLCADPRSPVFIADRQQLLPRRPFPIHGTLYDHNDHNTYNQPLTLFFKISAPLWWMLQFNGFRCVSLRRVSSLHNGKYYSQPGLNLQSCSRMDCRLPRSYQVIINYRSEIVNMILFSYGECSLLSGFRKCSVFGICSFT